MGLSALALLRFDNASCEARTSMQQACALMNRDTPFPLFIDHHRSAVAGCVGNRTPPPTVLNPTPASPPPRIHVNNVLAFRYFPRPSRQTHHRKETEPKPRIVISVR